MDEKDLNSVPGEAPAEGADPDQMEQSGSESQQKAGKTEHSSTITHDQPVEGGREDAA